MVSGDAVTQSLLLSFGITEIASSSAPEVTSLYVTTWVRVGVNRAQVLYDTVVSSVFHTFPSVSIEFWTIFCLLLLASIRFHTIPVPSVTRHSVEHSGYLVQYIRLSLSSLRRQVESPVQ